MLGAVSDQDVTGSMREEELRVCANTMLFCIRDLGHSWLLIHRRWRGPGGVSLGTMGTATTAPRLRKALVYIYGFIIKDKIGVHLGEKDAQSRVWGQVGSLIPSSGISLYQHLLMFPDKKVYKSCLLWGSLRVPLLRQKRLSQWSVAIHSICSPPRWT